MAGKKRKTKKRYFLAFIALFLVLGLGITAAFTLYIAFTVKQLPSPESFGTRQVSESSKIFDRTGKIVLYEIHGKEKRTTIPFEEIPDYLKKATLAAENANFYKDPAFDWRAIIRAFIVNIKEGRFSQGGSTITQQLARNAFLSSEKTISRKVKELILAIQLESRYTKDQILEFYLNQVPYGSNAYGVEAGSQTFFAKPAKDLNLAEAATLASLTKAPSYYSPWGDHQKELIERKNYILDRMYRLGYISAEEWEEAKKVKPKFAPPSLGSIKAPHFSLAVKDELVARYGEDVVSNGGLKVITTLDWEMQQIAERVVYEGALRNERLYNGKNAALVAQDPKTGQILALVGSRDYFDVENEGNFNVAIQGLRQPGSALKPFAYLTAFEKGYSPKTVVFDVETEFDTTGKPENSYKPQNFDEKFRGPVTLEEGLAQSINVPSVKTLYLANLDDVLKKAERFGITTLKERWRYGLSLVLGGGEVKLVDLVNAYATLAEEGLKHRQQMILEVKDKEGKTLESYHDESERVMDQKYPRLINYILSDKELRAPLFQNSLALTVFPNRDVALKTGTTNDYRDAWALGYTPSLVVGVWAGNNDNTPMKKHGSSILAAVPIWSAFLKEVLEKYPPESFEKPDTKNFASKPMLNGQFIISPSYGGRTYPQIHSILYYVNPKDPLGPPPEYPNSDPQFENWEKGVMDWAKINIPNFPAGYNEPLPPGASFENARFFEPEKDVVILNMFPRNGDFVGTPFTLSADIKSTKGLGRVELYLNRALISNFVVSGNTYRYQYYFENLPAIQNLIEIKAINIFGEETKTSIIVFRK